MLAFSVGRLLCICDKFADMNEVMFYTLNQIPVTKEDIITGKFEDKMNSSMMANYEKVTVSIPSGRTKAIGKEEIGVPSIIKLMRYYGCLVGMQLNMHQVLRQD